MARDSNEQGRIAIEEIQNHLKEAIVFKLGKLNEAGKNAKDISREYGVSDTDLYSMITGRGSVPLARVIMFAAALGYDVQLVLSEDSDKYEKWKKDIRK